MKNALLQGIVINMILLFIFLWVFFLNVFPEYKNISIQKGSLQELVQDFEFLESKGIAFWDLRSTANAYKLITNDIANQSITNFPKDIFNEYFVNTGSLSYSEFLSWTEERVIEKLNSPEFSSNLELIDTILPVYTPNQSIVSGINDFYFVNYVEKLLYSFNLQSEWEIGISLIENIFDESILNEDSENVNVVENIYKVPLSLSLEWRKSDIVRFLHFLENVGSLQYSNSMVEVVSDDFLSVVLEWQENTSTYNIYKNQLATIREISLADYPDSWSVIAEESLIDTMILRQGRESYRIEVGIDFYVSWLPRFEIKDYIEDFIVRFDELKAQISESNSLYASQNTQITWDTLNISNSLQSLELIMLSFEEEISEYRWIELQDITENDNEMIQLHESKLQKIEESYNSSISLLNQE